MLPDDAFAGVLLLLQLEDVLDEELLQLLVGEVDAELLEAARGERTNVLQGNFFFFKINQ